VRQVAQGWLPWQQVAQSIQDHRQRLAIETTSAWWTWRKQGMVFISSKSSLLVIHAQPLQHNVFYSKICNDHDEDPQEHQEVFIKRCCLYFFLAIIFIIRPVPSPGFRSWKAKTTKGGHFLNTILDVCCNRGPNMKWPPPSWRRPCIRPFSTCTFRVPKFIKKKQDSFFLQIHLSPRWKHSLTQVNENSN